MSTQSTQSHACCTVPPVISDGYQEKGKWGKVDGLKLYSTRVTGGDKVKTGILIVYDIFGFFPQTLQAADIIAEGDKEKQYQVFMPDFFDGEPADISWYPPDTKEKESKLGEFFGNQAAPEKTLNRLPKILDELEKEYGIEKWGVLGYCWGGKIVNLSSQEGTRFSSAVSCHPAMVDANDAPGVTIPFAMLPSGDEPKEDVEKWQKALKVKNIVRWYPDQVHGFMAARSDLKDDNVKKNYEDAYKVVLDWFHETL